jgi:hypothetical protein
MATGIAVGLAALGVLFQVFELARQTSWLPPALQWVQENTWLPQGLNVPRDIPLGPLANLLLLLALMIAVVRMARIGREARRLAARVVASEYSLERVALQLAVLGDKVGSQMADLEGRRQYVNELERHPR